MKFENCKYDHLDLAEKFLEMAEKFLPYAADQRCELDMYKCYVVKDHCGTVACHGGYAAIVLLKAKSGTDYGQGRRALAEFLGFNSDESLIWWADNNPSIWGNYSGANMFCDIGAFKPFKRTSVELPENLQTIVAHYLRVAKNLMEIKE